MLGTYCAVLVAFAGNAKDGASVPIFKMRLRNGVLGEVHVWWYLVDSISLVFHLILLLLVGRQRPAFYSLPISRHNNMRFCSTTSRSPAIFDPEIQHNSNKQKDDDEGWIEEYESGHTEEFVLGLHEMGLMGAEFEEEGGVDEREEKEVVHCYSRL